MKNLILLVILATGTCTLANKGAKALTPVKTCEITLTHRAPALGADYRRAFEQCEKELMK